MFSIYTSEKITISKVAMHVEDKEKHSKQSVMFAEERRYSKKIKFDWLWENSWLMVLMSSIFL